MRCLIVLLSLLITLSSSTYAASIPIFYLNSSLPSTWHNNISSESIIRSNDGSNLIPVLERRNGLGFVFGFFCTMNCTFYSLSVIIVGGSNPVVVWSANRHRLVREDAVLQLNRDGDLVLRDFDGSSMWSTTTSGKSVSGMNMTESGNLILFNEKLDVVWQSFDYPTNTLLAGQRLHEGRKLVSSSSATDMGSGLYYMTLNVSVGLAAFTQVPGGKPQMYYRLAPEESSSDQNSAVGHCRLLKKHESKNSTRSFGGEFLVNLGTNQDAFVSDSYEFSFYSPIEYVRLDSDGHLKLYRINNSSGASEASVKDMVSDDFGVCQHPRSCGDYGVCKDGQCSCPSFVDGTKYFKQNGNESSAGCSRVTPLSCPSSPDKQHLVEVRNGDYFNMIDSDAAVLGIKDIDACKQACMQNCSCGATFFRYDKNASDGYCYMPSEVLSIRDGEIPNNTFTYATYIKVEVPKRASNSTRPPRSGKSINLPTIIGVSSSIVIVISAIAIIFVVKSRKNSKEDEERDYHVPGMPVRFSYEELRVATNNFSEKLGEGGFRSVFKGTLQDGTVVAVKKLHKMGNALTEFLAEVETIGITHHYNLVRLVGFCAEKSCSLLVYDYMYNGSLDNWIFKKSDNSCLDWEARKRVILEIAKGLAYLHEECRKRIIHLDIKPQNVLLDEIFSAKISDFGLSTLIGRDESGAMTTLRGTPGYIAPECGRANITTKVDTYSFGIVLLEIISGRKNLDRKQSESRKHLLALVQRKAEENRLLDIVENYDGENVGNGKREEMERMIRIAAWCLQNEPKKRPLMSTVVKVLEGVMDVDTNIDFNFTHAMGETSPIVRHEISWTTPQASILSNPR